MSQPPEGDDYPLTERRKPGADEDAGLASRVESRLPFGTSTEGLCHTMPELGSMPFVQGREKSRRVVRLVSANAESDLSIELQAGVNKIGRQRNGNHIVLVSGEISRFHAEVHVSDDAIVVRDLGSSNGTFVNGQNVKEAQIDAGDTVGFSSQFLFKVQIDMAMQAPEVQTLEPGGGEPLPRTAPPPAVPGDVPSSLEERRRRLELVPRVNPVRAQPAQPAHPAHPAQGRHSTAPRGVAAVPSRPASPRGSLAAPQRPAPIVPGPSRSASGSPSPAGPVQPAPPGPVQVARSRTGAHAPRPSPAIAPPAVAPVPLGPLPPLPPPGAPQHAAPAAAGGHGAARGAGPLSPKDSLLEPIEPAESGAAGGDVSILERERRQLAVLYQVSKRCMAAENLAELDRLLINVLERIVAFERGFITYQLPSGDWKLVMSPKGDRWDRTVVRNLLQTALRGKAAVVVKSSASDDQLGNPGQGRTDARLLLPLRTRSAPVGAIFLIAGRADSFDDQTVDFLSLFSDIAALAVVSCSRMEGRAS